MKIYSKRLLLLVVLISSLYFPVLNRHAEGAESYAAVTSNKNMPLPDQEEKTFSNPAHMFPLAEEVSGLKLQNQLQEYLDKRDWKLGFSKKGTYLGWGEAEINVPPDDLRFGQARIIAFEKAFADAKVNMLKQVSVEQQLKPSASFSMMTGNPLRPILWMKNPVSN